MATTIEESHEFDSIFACVCDLNGTLRGKRVPMDQARKVADGEIRMPLSVANVDIWGEDIENSELVFKSGDADGVCERVDRALIPVTWTHRPSALALLWMRHEDGTPFMGDPRCALATVTERFKASGLTPVVATEMEFYLCDPSNPQPRAAYSPLTGRRSPAGVLSLDELEQFEAFLNDVYDACMAQDIPADAVISEGGAGQFEVNMKHIADPLRAADNAILFKRLVRGIARQHGFCATFMAKPFGEAPGNGMHVHFSLTDDQGRNVFDNGADAGTPLLHNAIAGLLATMHENTLVFAPHANSFRRLQANSHAPTRVAWGYENRTTALRIPGGDHKARRIEHRVAGADANPYLVLASVLGGALTGIEQQLTPAKPITGDGYKQGATQLPETWNSAIKAFEDGKYVQQIYSKQLQRMFVQCKTQELARFSRQITDFEYQSYLEIV